MFAQVIYYKCYFANIFYEYLILGFTHTLIKYKSKDTVIPSRTTQFCSSGTLLGTYNQITSIKYILQRFEHDYERTRTFPINV